ncbi:hypothetical protein GPJ56_005047 [Histomonas meleagridis]|uniref:uncharacterized protein n=1 Tax=Histomonas meleagridis TaxID=135588 RepID=UPI00355A157F|nr:hypothetical protein GPJ56_005047 [Histomonas meleagridis]KAH0802564.1 hypothetical protein GO595_004613 [Histomonas meleagridis]
MFLRHDPIPDHFGNTKYPTAINEMLSGERYDAVADHLIRHQIPFNRAFIFLSNYPTALAKYLYACIPELEDFNPDDDDEKEEEKNEDDKKEGDKKEEEKKDGEKKEEEKKEEEKKEEEKKEEDKKEEDKKEDDKKEGEQKEGENKEGENKEGEKKEGEQKEEELVVKGNKKKPDYKDKVISPKSAILMNLYVSVAIPLLTTQTEEEREKSTKAIVKLVKTFPACFDKHQIYHICREISDDNLAQQMYLIFGDIWEYSMLMFEKKDYKSILNEISRLPEQRRVQVYKRFPPEFHLQMVNSWARDLPNSIAIFPMLCDMVFAEIFNEAPVPKLQAILERMYTRRLLLNPPHRQIQYYLLVKSNSLSKMEVIYKHDLFQLIGFDYVIRHLEHRKLYSFAADFCAHIKDRHYSAITYSILDSIRFSLDLLVSTLKDAEDVRDCWMIALERSRNTGDEYEWRNLLKTATTSGFLALDDIFPMMPVEMPIDEFQPTILQSIRKYQRITQQSKDKIEQLINRSNEQREVIRVGPSMACQMDPLAICWFCKGSVYKDRFLVFPCNHCVHVNCFLANSHLYYTPVERLNLVSLSAKAMREEKRAIPLANVICRSCPVCGELSTKVLNKDFAIKEEVTPRKMWGLPPAMKKNDEEEEEE